jgi:hypothetical protein
MPKSNPGDDVSQRSWITSNIAWLSVCFIAAAWGSPLFPSESWAHVWGLMGVFGLAAALGLASVAAVRQRQARRR